MSGHIADSKSIHYNTPKHIVDAARRFYNDNIDLDPASNDFSIVGAKTEYKLPYSDGLTLPWYGNVWINPPFGNGYYRTTEGKIECLSRAEFKLLTDEEKELYSKKVIKDWIKKCSTCDAKQVLALIPSYTDSTAWQQIVFPSCDAICFLAGRVNFDLAGVKQDSAPMGMAIVLWANTDLTDLTVLDRFREVFSRLGTVIDWR